MLKIILLLNQWSKLTILLIVLCGILTNIKADAATFRVTRGDDRNLTTAGCPSSASSDCSIREAMTIAGANPGVDTIDIVVSTITLTIAAPIVISGSGLTLNGNGVTIQRSATAGNFAIFFVSTPTAAFNSLTIAGGVEASGLSGGGGIFVASSTNLSINNSTIRDNSAGNGGAIYIDGGSPTTQVTLTNSIVSNNSATESNAAFFGGGGIYVEPNSVLTLNSSTISGNNSPGNGGGIFVDGTLNATNSQINGNSANTGGGIRLGNNGSVNLQNTNVFNNIANIEGGGILNLIGTLTINGGSISGNNGSAGGGSGGGGLGGGGLDNQGSGNLTGVTISGNFGVNGGGIINKGNLVLTSSSVHSNSATVGGGISNNSDLAVMSLTNTTVSGNSTCNVLGCRGGGISNGFGTINLLNVTISNNTGFVSGISNIGTIKSRNTIIAGNRLLGVGAISPDVSGTFTSLGNNFIGNNNNSTGFNASSDIVGTSAAPLEARLRTLGNYGSSTLTQPPFRDSPAVDAGNNCVLVLNACPSDNAPQIITTDQRGRTRIGNITNFRVDIGAVELQTAVVTTVNNSGSNSLRGFVDDAFPYDLITFDSASLGSSPIIRLTSPLIINRSVEIFGLGATATVISGNNAVRVLEIQPGGNVRLTNLQISQGNTGGLAGANISNSGTLAISNCFITIGRTTGNGGGLFNAVGATADINGSTFVANQAGVGGGVFNTGTLNIANSTFSFNTASVGAAISSADSGANSPLLRNVTVANNTATSSGGGIRYVRTFAGSSFSLQNTIVANNTAPTGTDAIGDFNSLGNNLIGTTNGSTGFIDGTNDDIAGTSANPISANLETFTNHGGQTSTQPPLPSSRAINNGADNGLLTDQRGIARNIGGRTDIGAVEFNLTPVGTLENNRRRLPNSRPNQPFTQTLEAFGSGTFTFSATNLPPFLTLNQPFAPQANAILSGTPTSLQAGIYSFSITATNSGNFTVTNDYTLNVLAPTAAAVNIRGRVLTTFGRGIFGTQITLVDQNGRIRYARTNPFGYYRFAEVEAGQIYVVSVKHKHYDFETQVINATEELNELNFIAKPPN
jgi:Putative Ig domain/Carboxypeptidase regulatory-like domain